MLKNIASLRETNDDLILTKIFEIYYGTMFMIAKRILSDHALAEDAVSDALIKIKGNLHKIGDIESRKTKGYIVIMVKNVALNILKKQKNYVEEPIDDLAVYDTNVSLIDNLNMKESYNLIIQSIMSLPKSLSDTLYLSVVYEHSNEEIADILNITNDAVRQRLSRAKKQLKQKLARVGVGLGG